MIEEPREPTPGELVAELNAGHLTEDELLTAIMMLPRPEPVDGGGSVNEAAVEALHLELAAGRIDRKLYDRAVEAATFSPIAVAREYEERVRRGEIDTSRPGVIQWAIERMNLRASWTAEHPDRPLDAELAADAELRQRMLHSPEPGWATIVLRAAEELAAVDPDLYPVRPKQKLGELRFAVEPAELALYYRNRPDFRRIAPAAAEVSRGQCQICGRRSAALSAEKWVRTLCSKHGSHRAAPPGAS